MIGEFDAGIVQTLPLSQGYTVKLLMLRISSGHLSTIEAILDRDTVQDAVWRTDDNAGIATGTCVVTDGSLQRLMDDLQKQLSGDANHQLHVLDIESSSPDSALEDAEPGLTRNELHEIAVRGARADRWFVLIVALSTLVAAFGLVRDNVAVIIGAMVIAPLLSPNLAFALANALAERAVALRAVGTLLLGSATGFLVALLMGYAWPTFPIGSEITARTDLTFDSALLAIAAGFAAVLSMTRGLSETLVGVMVAVALIPPLATAGLLIGRGFYAPGFGALLLFAVNVSAINLAGHLAFTLAGVAPRTLSKAKDARRRVLLLVGVWTVVLLGLYQLA